MTRLRMRLQMALSVITRLMVPYDITQDQDAAGFATDHFQSQGAADRSPAGAISGHVNCTSPDAISASFQCTHPLFHLPTLVPLFLIICRNLCRVCGERLSSDPQHPSKSTVVCSCNPGAGGVNTVRSLELADQPTAKAASLGSVRDPDNN